jgi:glycosyltransferase involved in cell wall biosynthesis
MKENFIFSIVVPTKDRQLIALKTIKHLLNATTSETEIVVQDNSEDQSLRDMILILNPPVRLKYFYRVGEISFTQNFEDAINNSSGKFILLIGDDDGITFDLVDIVKIMDKRKIQAIVPTQKAIYFWPNSGVALNNKNIDNGYLSLNKFNLSCKKVNSKKEVSLFMKNGLLNYLNFNFVKAYHGIVRRDFFNKIKQQNGRIIGGLSPDIYLAAYLSMQVNKFLIVDFPLTISGINYNSGSASSSRGEHTGPIEKAPHFKGHKDYQWNKKVPYFYSVETIWADSFMAAFEDFKKYGIISSKINFSKFYAFIYTKYPMFKLYTNEVISKILNPMEKIKLWLYKIFFLFQNLLIIKFINFFIMFIKKGFFSKKYFNINNIEQASLIIKNLSSKNFKILLRQIDKPFHE